AAPKYSMLSGEYESKADKSARTRFAPGGAVSEICIVIAPTGIRLGNARDTRALSSTEPGPSMFSGQIKDWANGNNAARINLLVRHVVMPLDVIEVHRLGNAIMLV